MHLHAGDVNLVAKLPVESSVGVGDDVTLTIPLEKLYLFDRETEAAVRVGT